MKKKKLIILILLLIIAIIILTMVIINKKNFKEEPKEKIELPTDIIEGEERLEAEEETNKVVYEMLRDIDIIKYAKNNQQEKVSLKELRETFNLDTTTFEEMKYNCSIENTYLKFNEDYNQYSIVYDCKRLQRKSN